MEKAELSKCFRHPERKLGVTMHFSEILKLQFGKQHHTSGLEITAGQRTMSGLIGDLTGQTLALPVKLTGHIRSY